MPQKGGGGFPPYHLPLWQPAPLRSKLVSLSCVASPHLSLCVNLCARPRPKPSERRGLYAASGSAPYGVGLPPLGLASTIPPPPSSLSLRSLWRFFSSLFHRRGGRRQASPAPQGWRGGMGGRRRGSPPPFQYAVHPMIIVGYHGMRPRGDGTGGGGRWVVPVRSRPPGVRPRSRPERRGDTEDGGRPGETPHGRRGRGESHQCTVRWFYFSNPSSPRAREASRGPHTPPPTCGRSASGPSPGSEGGGGHEGME